MNANYIVDANIYCILVWPRDFQVSSKDKYRRFSRIARRCLCEAMASRGKEVNLDLTDKLARAMGLCFFKFALFLKPFGEYKGSNRNKKHAILVHAHTHILSHSNAVAIIHVRVSLTFPSNPSLYKLGLGYAF